MKMAAELVNSATSEKLLEMDWSKNIEICELVARDHRHAKDVVKAIKKCVGSKNANTQLYSVLLLEMLLNNVGEPVHYQVVDKGLLHMLVKIVKKKTDLPVREKIFLLLDAAQTYAGGASGKFPQFYSAYYELVRAGVQFPQRPRDICKSDSTNSKVKHDSPAVKPSVPANERNPPQAQNPTISESSILDKAGTALDVLRDVLDAIDSRNPEGARGEFTLDLVEQCSFHKQRVMQLAVTSRNEKMVLQAVEINEQLDRVLRRHDALLSGRLMPESNHIHHGEEEDEEEEAEQLFRRMQKGKARMRPEDEANEMDHCPFGLRGHPVPGEIFNRPLSIDRREKPLHMELNHKAAKPFGLNLNQRVLMDKQAAFLIPPPPSKHIEREKFFQNNKSDDFALNGHLRRSLSLHSSNVSSSHSGSTDFSD